MKFYSNINLYELSKLKNEARKLSPNLQIVKNAPNTYSNGHIAELAFFGMMGVLQKYLGSQGHYFCLKTSVQLDREDIDVSINHFPIQLKSQFGDYPQMSDSYHYTMWLSYDKNEVNIELIKGMLKKLNIECKLSPAIIKVMNHIWDSYMLHYNIV